MWYLCGRSSAAAVYQECSTSGRHGSRTAATTSCMASVISRLPGACFLDLVLLRSSSRASASKRVTVLTMRAGHCGFSVDLRAKKPWRPTARAGGCRSMSAKTRGCPHGVMLVGPAHYTTGRGPGRARGALSTVSDSTGHGRSWEAPRPLCLEAHDDWGGCALRRVRR